MFGLFQKLINKQAINTFNKQLRVIRVVIYADLRDDYSHEYEPETAGVLAAQVVNYFQGEDFQESYTNATDSIKVILNNIREQILTKADHLLRTNRNIRELTVYTLRMKVVLRFSQLGESYLQSAEKLRIENILKKYGSEFPEEASPKLYGKIVDRFLTLPHKLGH